MSQPESTLSRRAKFTAALDQVVDLGIAGVLFAAPLAMAGRYPPGRLILAILVGITAIAFCLSKALSGSKSTPWVWSGVEWLAVGGVLIVVLQLIPLPTQTLELLSPSTAVLLPLHADAASQVSSTNGAETPLFGRWSSVSLAPHATRGGLVHGDRVRHAVSCCSTARKHAS